MGIDSYRQGGKRQKNNYFLLKYTKRYKDICALVGKSGQYTSYFKEYDGLGSKFGQNYEEFKILLWNGVYFW